VENKPAQLVLRVDGGRDADDEDRAELARRLRKDLLELDVEAVEPVRSRDLPVGAKGDAVTIGALAVTLAPAALTALTNMLQSWLSRRERASVTLESRGEKIVVTGNPSKEQQRMIDAFVRRHKA